MLYQSTSRNRTGTCGSGRHHKEGASRYTWSYTAYIILPQIDDQQCHAQQTPMQLKKLAPLTTRSSSWRWVSAAEHHTTEQYSKTGSTKPRLHFPRSNPSWNTREEFLKIPNLWEAALEAQRRWSSKFILELNVTANISSKVIRLL